LARVTGLGKELGPRLHLERAGLVHPGEDNPKVVVVGERNANQVLEHWVLEYSPPGKVGERVGGDLVCRVAEIDGRIDDWTMVIWANGAAGERQGRHAAKGEFEKS
jgi:hypothetical protein